ncbi:acyl-CoA/acyl-ACP dehydrogenase [Xanthomonas campestris pv. campestris]|uniref:acyl-CoA dehydrogenase family protein n=1 Tax=Xanthomonas campestris TaxID=339 RepID=UPI001E2B0C62|nr:acyl-CoA dehydrogenase family protein [Xanthomonas campestris]MCD0254761.1 acyl-CoA/acyl-ACP dehydrogenase [Xanthomonas campestris pv. campestris]MEB1300201.1 acyl-CoA dehydrogenase family protein [Xanthomonas campestris pv. campestris]MEB1308995.1 acyl-CoA dehydrogenase family protein [Xanthomonas campestris pv. campestris]MEB1334074.1 acyl-CoA dehydrogenase family protein [Xanthomonas campestris pv. campestris]MEB1899962.1 acyl-CoA dehydrogenase family protein [Xanthomonas campestris pv. 
MKAVSDSASPGFDLAAALAWIRTDIGATADTYDAAQQLPEPALAGFRRHGLFGAAVPAAYGGTGLSPGAVGALCEALGWASGSALSLFTVHGMVCTAVARWGTSAQREHWLPALASGARVGALAVSEPEVGSDVGAVATRFERRGADIVVDGVKTWTSFGQIADGFLVAGMLDGELSTLLVPRDAPGFAIEPIGGMFGFRAGMLAQLEFRECAVPATGLLGRPGFGLAQIVGSVLDHGRYCIAWGAAGLARACLEASLDYAGRRIQHGVPLAEHALVQALLADMLVETRAARLLCEEAAQARTQPGPDMIVRTSAAKYYAARSADRAAAAALQIHGAHGLSEGSCVQRYLRDAKVFNIIEGSTQIQQMLLGRLGAQWVGQWTL